MKFISLTILIALIVVFVNPFFPYWIVMILIGILSVAFGLKGFVSFLAGGLGMGLAWVGQTVYLSFMTGSSLPDQMAEIMGASSGVFLSAITGLIGFLLGAFSAYSGSLFRRMLKKRPDNIYRG
ncbi:hypothetical protein JYB62_01505 [Algoriphagus lutimaris]|uniref:hypothetical protein n=1 Tax=Algoriphagus lutimaris TaxID=613197 RepID=UPI00196A9BE0|nr:hypothetical protein [Algoriphagus lutimaris]MBN3518662.1 hypothetical protein [Algoriphagus lutimaris]